MQAHLPFRFHAQVIPHRIRRSHPTICRPIGSHSPVAQLGSWRDDEHVYQYCKDKLALQEQLKFHEQVVQGINEIAIATGGPLKPAPTRHAPTGKLLTQSLDGNSQYILRTFSGGAVEHMNTTIGVVPAIGLVYAKVSMHAAMDKGTPFLDVELTGIHGKGVLVCCLPSPRLSLLLHPEYLVKYWRTPVSMSPSSSLQQPLFNGSPSSSSSTNPTATSHASSKSSSNMDGSGSSNCGTLPSVSLTFEELERRVHARMPPQTTGFSAPPPPPPGTPPPPPPLYTDFHSASLYTRLAAAPGLLFCFDPANPAALEAAKSDVGAALTMWGHWVTADMASGSLKGQDLQECRIITAATARFLQYDPDVGRVERMLGKEAIGKMMETVSGEASLNGRPWWM